MAASQNYKHAVKKKQDYAMHQISTKLDKYTMPAEYGLITIKLFRDALLMSSAANQFGRGELWI